MAGVSILARSARHYSSQPMNFLSVGLDKQALLQHLPEGDFLLIDDGPLIDQLRVRARKFDVQKHAFNPLKDMNHRRARELANVFYAASDQPESTLTVRNGKRALAKLLLKAHRLDEITGNAKDPAIAEALATVEDILFSPVLDRVLNTGLSFPFSGRIIVRLDRAVLGDFDAFVLGNLLISQYPGPVVIPDFGFYAHKGHMALIRQNRLIAGVSSFDEVPAFRSQLLMIEEKVGSRCTPDDAKFLAMYAGLKPDPMREDSDYNRFIDECIRAA